MLTLMNLALWAQGFQPPGGGFGGRPGQPGFGNGGNVNINNADLNKALNDAGSSIFAGMMWFMIIMLLIAIPVIIGMWKMFEKAGEPGWASLVPIYNYMVMAKIGGKSEMYGLLVLVPFVGFIFAIIILIDVAHKFGQSTGYAIGMILLPFIFIPMLGFGSAEYEDNRSRSRSRRRVRVEDDEEEDDRPRKRRVVVEEDDEDDRPRKRRPVAEDDDDEEPRPKRKPDPRVRKREDRYE